MRKTKRKPRGRDMFGNSGFKALTPKQASIVNPVLGTELENEQMINEVLCNSLPHRKSKYEE